MNDRIKRLREAILENQEYYNSLIKEYTEIRDGLVEMYEHDIRLEIDDLINKEKDNG